MMAVDHMILSAANSCRALYRTHGRFSPVMPRLGFTFPVRPVERLQDQGKLAWSDTSRRSAVITDLGRQVLGAPSLKDRVVDTSAGCELCGAQGRLTVTMLKEPWSDQTVNVRACTPCAAIAWRTVEAIGRKLGGRA